MKKLTLTALMIFGVITLFAQNHKGWWQVGASLGGADYNNSYSETSYSYIPTTYSSKGNGFSLYVNPTLGYYVTDKLVLGGSVYLSPYTGKYTNSQSNSTATSETKYSYFAISIGPMLKCYLGKNQGKGMPYFMVDENMTWYPGYKSTYTSSTGGGSTDRYDKYSYWNTDAVLGYEHFLNEHIGLNFAVGYRYTYYKYTVNVDQITGTDYKYSSKGHYHDATFSLGLVMHLDWHKRRK
jgi:hypothetical protein